jgi:hypothetical protein
MATIAIIGCPAPFERLEAFAPTIGDRTTRKPYEKPRGATPRGKCFLVAHDLSGKPLHTFPDHALSE